MTDNPAKGIGELLALANIKRIVYVDDMFGTVNVEPVLGVLKTLTPAERIKAVPEWEAIGFVGPDEVWVQKVRDKWSEITQEDQKAIFSALQSKSDPETQQQEELDKGTDTGLSGLFAALPIEYLKLSLKEWQIRNPVLIEETSTIGTFFLFDLDFSKESHEGGDATTGIMLLASTQASMQLDTVTVFGLLSHLCQRGQEHDVSTSLSREHNLDPDKFVLVSKTRTAAKDYSGFARMLKLALLNRPCSALRDRALTILKETLNDAQSEVAKINVYDIEHIVFTSALRDGTWELDTLFRLFSIYQRKFAREKAFQDADLGESVAQLRKMAAIITDNAEAPISSSWKIRQQELYEGGTHLNRLHSPTDLGDIFQKQGGQNPQYILLGQPCDLMVRSDGKRNHNLASVFLARIKPGPPDNSIMVKNPGVFGGVSELPCFDLEEGKPWYVYFSDIYVVDLLALDMCVFREDGSACFCLADSCPEGVIPSWRSRYTKVGNEVEKVLKQVAKLTTPRIEVNEAVSGFLDSVKGLQKGSTDEKEVIKHLTTTGIQLKPTTMSTEEASKLVTCRAPLGTTPLLPRGKVTAQDRIEYPVKRVRRLLAPKSTEMLQRFLNYWARTALDHEFALLQHPETGESQGKAC